jgi:hypothetical protein
MMQYALGCWVGLCCAMRSSLRRCRSVVLPALSRPRNKILAFLCARPASRGESKLVWGARKGTGSRGGGAPASHSRRRGEVGGRAGSCGARIQTASGTRVQRRGGGGCRTQGPQQVPHP